MSLKGQGGMAVGGCWRWRAGEDDDAPPDMVRRRVGKAHMNTSHVEIVHPLEGSVMLIRDFLLVAELADGGESARAMWWSVEVGADHHPTPTRNPTCPDLKPHPLT